MTFICSSNSGKMTWTYPAIRFQGNVPDDYSKTYGGYGIEMQRMNETTGLMKFTVIPSMSGGFINCIDSQSNTISSFIMAEILGKFISLCTHFCS